MNLGVSFKFVSEINKLEKSIDNMHRRCLYKAGGFNRTAMKQSIGRKMESSNAGQIPVTHGQGKYSLKNLWFETDFNRLAAPIGFKSEEDELGRIAMLHEKGGVHTFRRVPAMRC